MFQEEFHFGRQHFFTLPESQKRASDLPVKKTVLGTIDSCQLELNRISDQPILLKLSKTGISTLGQPLETGRQGSGCQI